jgi:hypothetical protein
MLSFIAVKVNNVQLMLLAVEGVGLCVVCTFWMWMLLQRVAAQRYSMFCVFMVRVLDPDVSDYTMLSLQSQYSLHVRFQTAALLVLCGMQVIPSSLVRRLAMRKLRLTDEEDEDDDNDNITYAAAKGATTNQSSRQTWNFLVCELSRSLSKVNQVALACPTSTMVSAGGKQSNDKAGVKDDGREHDTAIGAVDTTVSEQGPLCMWL